MEQFKYSVSYMNIIEYYHRAATHGVVGMAMAAALLSLHTYTLMLC